MSKAGKVTEVAPGIYFMDSQGLGPMDLSGVYIVVADGLTLIQTGGVAGHGNCVRHAHSKRGGHIAGCGS